MDEPLSQGSLFNRVNNILNIDSQIPEAEFIGDSTCIYTVKFDRTMQSGDLTVEFVKYNAVYTYHDVSNLMYFNLLRVTSKGWYFNRYIRNNYSFTRDS